MVSVTTEENVEPEATEPEDQTDNTETIPSHLEAFKDMSEEQVKHMVNNARALDTLSKDPEFDNFYRNAIARITGVNQETTQRETPIDNEYQDLSDKEVLTKLIESSIDSKLSAFVETLKPIINDYSTNKLNDLRKNYENFDRLMPKIQEFKANNPWAANAPVEHIVKMLDYDNLSERTKNQTIQELKKTNGNINNPRRNTRDAGLAFEKGTSTLEILESIAKDKGIPLT